MKRQHIFYVYELFLLTVCSLVFGVLLGIVITQNHCDNYYQQQITGLHRQLDKSHEQLAKKTKIIAELTENGG